MKLPPRSLFLALFCTLLSFVIAPATASAQGDAAAAEQLYKEGKALAKKGDFAAACPKFEASYKLDKGLGTLVNLADCHERIGKIASAWAEWSEAVDLANRLDDDRGKMAAKRRDKLEPKLPKLEVRVSNPVGSLSVYRGDTIISDAAYGTPLAVDPGEITVGVRRGDKVLKTETVTAKEAETVSVAFDLGALDKEFPEEKPPPPPAVVVAPPPSKPAGPPPSSTQKTLGYVIGGAGVVALATAGVLTYVAMQKKSKADEPDQCVNQYCSPNGFDTIDSAKSYATIAQWVGIGGVLLTSVGATLIFTAPSAPEQAKARARAPRAAVAPWVAPTGGGVSVTGSL